MNRTRVISIIGIALLAIPLALSAQDTAPNSSIYCPMLTRTLSFRMNDSTTGGQVTELHADMLVFCFAQREHAHINTVASNVKRLVPRLGTIQEKLEGDCGLPRAGLTLKQKHSAASQSSCEHVVETGNTGPQRSIVRHRPLMFC